MFVLVCLIPVLATILFGGVDTGTWGLIVPLVAITALFWIGDGLRKGEFVFNASWLLVPLILLCLLGVVQIIFGASLDPYSTRLFLVRLVCYTVFFAAAMTFVDTRKRLNRLVTGIIIFGAVMAFYAILQRLGSPDAIYGTRKPSGAVVFGPFVNQHHFAAFMEMTSALAVSLLFGRTISREKKFLIGGCLLLSSLAVVLTSSRGGLMGLVAGSAFVLVISYFVRRRSGASSERRRFGRAASIAGAVAGLGFFVGLVIFLGGDEGLLRATGLAMSGDDPSNGRLHFWSIALKIFYEHPILGAGLDAFGVAFTRHDTWPGVFRIEQAHNDYLQTLADAGLAGFAAVAAFIFLLFRNGRQLISSERDDFRLRAAIGALGGCFAILLHSFFDFPLRTPSNAFFFLLLVVIATVNVPKKSSTAKSP